MKLFLVSKWITETMKDSFDELVGKPVSACSFALIENAADPYIEEQKGFVYETRERLSQLQISTTLVDLRSYQHRTDELYDLLKKFDVIWVGGGNVFYLRWLFKETGFDTIAKQLLDFGVVYGGGSAGAIIAGPTLRHFDLVDNADQSPEVIYEGLGLIDVIILPHWGREKFQAGLEKIEKLYQETEYSIVKLTDDQGIIVKDGVYTIVT